MSKDLNDQLRAGELEQDPFAGSTLVCAVGDDTGPMPGLRVVTPGDEVDKPAIRLSTELDQDVAAAIMALADDLDVYQRGGALVAIVEEQDGTDEPVRQRIRQIPRANLRERLAAVRRFERASEANGELQVRPVHPPTYLAEAVIERGEWPGIRPLAGLITSPILRRDGSVLQTAGYDAATGLLYEPGDTFPAIPDAPTHDDARAAMALLKEPIGDFPFASNADRSGWLASVLTPFARPALSPSLAPMFVIEANVRGAGKTLLASVATTIATGRPVATSGAPDDDAEFDKRITSWAMAGVPLVVLDNVSGTIGWPSLDRALTSDRWGSRMLGASSAVDLPMRITWILTANNATWAADVLRRVQLVRLVSPEERPEERAVFTRANLIGWTIANRPRLAAAALIVLRAYCAAGRPDQCLAPWGSFESWSSLVRAAIVWAGEPDPIGARAQLSSHADDVATTLGTLLTATSGAFGRSPFTVSALLTATAPEGLRLAIVDACGQRGELPSRVRLGRYLGKHRDRVVGGLRFQDLGLENNVRTWAVGVRT